MVAGAAAGCEGVGAAGVWVWRSGVGVVSGVGAGAGAGASAAAAAATAAAAAAGDASWRALPHADLRESSSAKWMTADEANATPAASNSVYLDADTGALVLALIKVRAAPYTLFAHFFSHQALCCRSTTSKACPGGPSTVRLRKAASPAPQKTALCASTRSSTTS